MKTVRHQKDVIETKSAYISRVDNDTLTVILKPGALVTTKEYNGFEEKYYELMGRKDKFKFLVIVQEGAKVEKRYIDYFSRDYKTTYKKAEAYMVVSPLARMFLKILVKIVDNKYPVRLFNHEKEALDWLSTIK